MDDTKKNLEENKVIVEKFNEPMIRYFRFKSFIAFLYNCPTPKNLFFQPNEREVKNKKIYKGQKTLNNDKIFSVYIYTDETI